MKFYFPIFVLVLFFTSCNKQQYDLQIGDRVFKMDLLENVHEMEEAFLDQVMPIYEDLDVGESEWISYSLTKKVSIDSPEGKTIINDTTTSMSFRFFRQSDGLSGLEQSGSEGAYRLAQGEEMPMSAVRDALRDQLYGFQFIRPQDTSE